MAHPAVPRRLDARAIVEQKSCFLFGPRQTGKSTLIRQQFADCPAWNLLDQTLFVRLSATRRGSGNRWRTGPGRPSR